VTRAASLLLLLVACGAPAATTGATQPPGHAASAAAGADSARAHLCERSKALAQVRCTPFVDMDPSLLADCSVADGLYIAGAQACVDAGGCDAVQACLVAAASSDAPYAGPTAACALPAGASSVIPVGVDAGAVAASYGRADRAFGDSPSSRAQPIEVCGMPAETGYLTRVACADGSHAFPDRDAAASSRVGNVGPGGRCGRIVDQYAVPCPERTYEVFIDPYRCPARG
jgi:hypothetical protein